MKNEMCAEVRHDRAGHNYSLSDGADQHYNSCDIYIGLIITGHCTGRNANWSLKSGRNLPLPKQ